MSSALFLCCACALTSTAMGAAEVMHILDWSRPRAALTLDRINACAQPKPRGAPPLTTTHHRHQISEAALMCHGRCWVDITTWPFLSLPPLTRVPSALFYAVCSVCRVLVPSSVLCPLVLLGALGLGPRGQRLLQTSRRTAQLPHPQHNNTYTHMSEMHGPT